ncbi:uncharacterized protein [Clytia hemisphaerica]|uniref:uncharacterized protein n=1 Tax=Clytia hemisphaerica TaxID=252671 RepID=UPI0034D4D71B
MERCWFITKRNVHRIQERINRIECSNDVGKIPGKFDDFSFASFTADELKNWTLLFSLYALKGVIPDEHLRCWRYFVIACVYLCNQAITVADLTVIHEYLLKFCKSFESLYGSDAVTPNMHLHCHLVDCIKAYGPVYGFWLFSFERFNGLLERMPRNNKNIELQLMRRFERDLQAQNIPFPEALNDEFLPLFGGLNAQQRGALDVHDINVDFLLMSSKKTDYRDLDWSDLSDVVMKRKQVIYELTDVESESLTSMYGLFYPGKEIEVPVVCWKTSEVICNDVLYGAETSRSVRSSNVVAYWCGANGNVQAYESMYHSPRPGKIIYFIKHSLLLDGVYTEHILARVDWYLRSQNYDGSVIYGKPTMIFRDRLYEQSGSASFIPVQRIFSKYVFSKTEMNGNEMLVIVPRVRHLSI